MAAVSRYQYARTRNRVHRVVIEGGRAFKVENCNLDDVARLNLVDEMPEGTKCRWCFAGWVPLGSTETPAELEVAPTAAPTASKALGPSGTLTEDARPVDG